jgi:hypothetical protein
MLAHRNLLGTVSEGLVRTYLGAQGLEVFAPDSSHSRADLIYIDPVRGAIRVQVKTSSVFQRPQHSFEQCRLVRKGINTPYSEKEIDELWVVGTHLWCFPVSLTVGLTSITLGSSNPTPRKTIRTYNTEEFVKVRGNIDRPFRSRWLMDDPEPTLFLTNDSYAPSTQRKMKYEHS